MVKVSFNSALGRKDVKKDAEILLPEDEEAAVAVPIGHQSRAWCWCMCLSLALMLAGVVMGGVYLYHYYTPEEGQVFFCGVMYKEEDFMVRHIDEVEHLKDQHLLQLQERIQILVQEQVELVDIPATEFDNGDPAKIVNDFQRRLTTYHDLALNKCYIIPLNTSIVMPPKDLLELLVNTKPGSYLPQSYLVHEEMVVTERLQHVDQLGSYIYSLCHGKDTFKLQRRDHVLGMQKREVHNCRRIRHFESYFVVETQICEL